MSEETRITVKFWTIFGVVICIIGWLCLTVFANTGKIVRLESGMAHMQQTSSETKDLIKEIRADLKEHIVFTRNGAYKK